MLSATQFDAFFSQLPLRNPELLRKLGGPIHQIYRDYMDTRPKKKVYRSIRDNKTPLKKGFSGGINLRASSIEENWGLSSWLAGFAGDNVDLCGGGQD